MKIDGVSEQEMQALGTALNYVAKTPLERLGYIIDARMSFWHFQNLLHTAEKAKQILESRGIRPEQLDPKLREVVPILEASRNEDASTLQDMWAALLAASLDPFSTSEIMPFKELLSQITPEEARVLAAFRELHWSSIASHNQQGDVATHLNMNEAVVSLLFEHLRHLGLISTEKQDNPGRLDIHGLQNLNVYRLTKVGEAFIKRCTMDE